MQVCISSPSYLLPAAGGGGDPNWANVVLLAVNDNAADTTTTFDDQSTSNQTLTPAGDAQYDSAQAPSGMTTSMLLDGTGDWLVATADADFTIGTGDYTVEVWMRFPSLAVLMRVWDFNFTGDVASLALRIGTDGSIAVFDQILGDNIVFSAASAVAVDTWYHIEVSIVSGTCYLSIDGSLIDSTSTTAANYTSSNFRLGVTGAPAGNNPYNGWIGPCRLTKGVGRHTTTFTPPTLPLPTS